MKWAEGSREPISLGRTVNGPWPPDACAHSSSYIIYVFDVRTFAFDVNSVEIELSREIVLRTSGRLDGVQTFLGCHIKNRTLIFFLIIW